MGSKGILGRIIPDSITSDNLDSASFARFNTLKIVKTATAAPTLNIAVAVVIEVTLFEAIINEKKQNRLLILLLFRYLVCLSSPSATSDEDKAATKAN
jgi:hypothetical protein